MCAMPTMMGSKRASLSSSGKDNPEFNIVLLGALGVGKSGKLHVVYTATYVRYGVAKSASN